MYNRTVCHVCGTQCDSIKAYIRHYQVHRHDRNMRFPCCVSGCQKTYFTYKGLISHIERHQQLTKEENNNRYRDAGVLFRCPLDFCQHECSDIQELLAHLRSHITSGLNVPCPFEDCTKTFTNKKSFSSHLSRYHRNYSAHNVNQTLIVDQNVNFNVDDNPCHDGAGTSTFTEPEDTVDGDDNDHEDDDDPGVSVADFTKSIALFLLKLYSKFLVPKNTIQMIVEEMHDLFELSCESAKKHVQCMLEKAGTNCSISNHVLAGNILDAISELSWALDPSNHFKSPLCGALRSKHCRNCYYKKEFDFVKPVEIKLGVDSEGLGESIRVHPTI